MARYVPTPESTLNDTSNCLRLMRMLKQYRKLEDYGILETRDGYMVTPIRVTISCEGAYFLSVVAKARVRLNDSQAYDVVDDYFFAGALLLDLRMYLATCVDQVHT